jgi:hypothetical protein
MLTIIKCYKVGIKPIMGLRFLILAGLSINVAEGRALIRNSTFEGVMAVYQSTLILQLQK